MLSSSMDVLLNEMNLLGYTYKIYNSGYNTEMINAGDPLETPGGLYRGPRTTFYVN